jgi:pimeloyl-ACP methyl ester carboxylesterase
MTAPLRPTSATSQDPSQNAAEKSAQTRSLGPRNLTSRRQHVDATVVRDDSIAIRTTVVDGHTVRYSAGGEGPTILFLHGWGLGHHAYRPALRGLAAAGFRVVAPALPGFGGTRDLADNARTFDGYGNWVCRFGAALGLRNVTIAGHSFGGGVAMQVAANCSGLASQLVLLNSVGAPWRITTDRSGAHTHTMSERPMWSWGLGIPLDALSLLANATRVMPSVLEDVLPNVVRNPLGITRVGKLARTADLRNELVSLRSKNFPITVAHSDRDNLIPASSFDCLCDAAGVTGVVVPGNHSWPLTNPETLVRIVSAAHDSRKIAAA